jgi:hypothetical protein
LTLRVTHRRVTLPAASFSSCSVGDQFSADIVELERSHQMWAFLHTHYETIGQSTFLAAIRQEQLLHQGDNTVDAFFNQLSVV